MIYGYCIDSRKILVKSIMKKAVRKTKRPNANFWCLIQACKAIHAEAGSWYYMSTTFVFGNHVYWGSSNHINLQGMRAFTSRVSKAHLGMIRHVRIQVYYNVHQGAIVLGERAQAKSLESIGRSLSRNFPGLKGLTLMGSKLEQKFYERGLFPISKKAELRTMYNLLATILRHRNRIWLEAGSMLPRSLREQFMAALQLLAEHWELSMTEPKQSPKSKLKYMKVST